MKKKNIKVDGVVIRIQKIKDSDYVNLVDIAKKFDGDPRDYVKNWLRNGSTVSFLGVWEKVHNPDFNEVEFHLIKGQIIENSFLMSAKKWIERTGAIGIIAKSGRYGGTYAHTDIALQFATWLSPEFYVFLIKEFQRLKEKEFSRQNLEWHVSKITDNIEEIRNLLDSIPGQQPERNRLQGSSDPDEDS